MGVLADLVPKAQPALADGTDNAGGTEGATWRIPFIDVIDNNGDPIDLSDPSVSASCIVQDGIDGDTVIALDFAGGADGSFTLSADADDTAGLALDSSLTNPRDCRWSLVVTDGDDTVQFWHPLTAHFYIYPSGATI